MRFLYEVLYNILFVIIYAFISVAADINPPEQQLYGPGGKEYLYNKVTVTEYGRNDNKYYYILNLIIIKKGLHRLLHLSMAGLLQILILIDCG